MLRERVAELVSVASGGDLAVPDILAADCTLPALGVTSLTYIRLIDAIEDEFGVDLDLVTDPGAIDTLDGLVTYIAGHTDRTRT
ncbi:acyl carrier protein [Streptosporangiaceae bacterium NEAU-GS5]|nr:acyl carrier protein [Streptosporangiaceae bacterium NEAU-GS5]